DNAGNTSMFSSPALVVANALSVVVNDATSDTGDATPGDGLCETSTGNGICTLRAAIEETNLLAGPNTINFNVAGSPVTITPLSDLPPIDGPLTIDASTQPGSNCAAAVPVLNVELNATNEAG